MKLRRTLMVGMAGAALAYLFDPELGRSRRARLTGQAAGTVRGKTRDMGAGMSKKSEYMAGKAKGAMHEMRADQQPENSQTLVDKVRSEVLGREEWRDQVVNVSAADGVVMLNGQLEHPEQIERLLDQVRQVTGVQDVENALHLPGTLPPNKRDSMTARVT